jgi:DUF2891 family protein
LNALVAAGAACGTASRPPAPPDLPALTRESASNFARITLACVTKAYPNSPGYVLNAEADVQPPAIVHPSFYGCYDWHSSVHGHWMLARLLRLFPDRPERAQIVTALDANLAAEKILVEAAYFKRPGTQAFERTYGWAWTLKLAEELHASTSPGFTDSCPGSTAASQRRCSTSPSSRTDRIRSWDISMG